MFNLSREHITCLYMLTAENLISAVSLDLINLITMSIAAMLGAGAATSIFDAAVNLGAGLIMNKKQYQQQQALMDKSFEQQLDFWHQQQAYNDPSSQMRRLREAGLNPAMINGNGVNNTAGGLSSVGSPSAPPVAHGNANIAQSAQALQSILKMSEETGYIDTQNQVMAQELINKIIKNEIDTIAKDLKLTEAEIKELEKLSDELDFEEKYQFIYGRPSVPGGEVLANNRLTDYSNKLKAEANKISAEGNVASEQALKIESDRLFTEALTETENAMRDVRVNLAKAEASAANASATASIAQASKLMLEGKNIELQNQREVLRNSATSFYGFDPTTLPPELAATLMNNFAAVVESSWNQSTAKEAMDKCHDLLSVYRDKAIWTPTSDSYDWSNKVKLGAFEISNSRGVGKSN